MDLIGEFRTLVKSILLWLCVFVFFCMFFFLLGYKEMNIYGRDAYVPLPSANSVLLFLGKDVHIPVTADNSFAVDVFIKLRQDLLPENVKLITTNPLSAFMSQISLSVLLALLLTFPLLLYEMIRYIRPAMLPRERRLVVWLLPVFMVLFFSGCVFSYHFLIPETFSIFYPFTTNMGVEPFFSINEFVRFVFGLTIAVGVMFLLPLLVVILSYLRIIPGQFWIKKWRYALMFLLILSALIAPDVITMILLFLALMALYLVGCAFAKRFSREV